MAFRALSICTLLFACLISHPAAAEVNPTFANTTTGEISDTATQCDTPLVRTFSVPKNLIVTDVNIGVQLNHKARSDLFIALSNPRGITRVLTSPVGDPFDNLNVLFDDSAKTNIADHSMSDDTTTGTATYQQTLSPRDPLFDFNGQDALGTWTLEICDAAPGDDGDFVRADLFLTGTGSDLSLTKAVSTAAPASGAALFYTLTVTNDASSSFDVTDGTVQDSLPAGFTFTSATGTGSYSSSSGVWTVGSLAAGTTASITINGTASAISGITVTNIAQISSSSAYDPDSVPADGVTAEDASATTEDDYATVAFTTLQTIYNCATGTTATGSGYSNTGTGANLNRIFWFDWRCGRNMTFATGSIINKSWTVGDGLIVTAQVTGITAKLALYTTGSNAADRLDDLYGGVNPIGLKNSVLGQSPQMTLAFSATLNGQPVALRYVLADAEDAGGSEILAATTTGSDWALLEQNGVLTTNLSGASFTMKDAANAGPGTAIVETTATSPMITATLTATATQAMAFGIYTPYDYSDAPQTGTSYGSALHRTIPGRALGASFTTENTVFDSPTASGDMDNGATPPAFTLTQPAALDVSVTGSSFLSAWIDYNKDNDFADAGEQVATDVTDGGTGDSNGTAGIANGAIGLAITPSATASPTTTFMRLRYSSTTGAASSGLAGFGEVEDYQISIQAGTVLSVAKTSRLISDSANGTTNPKAIPGSTMRYCVLVTNIGTVTAGMVTMSDPLPSTTNYVVNSMATATSCNGTTTTEDDNNSGADESDPFGMAISGTTISGTSASLAAGASMAMQFNVTVK